MSSTITKKKVKKTKKDKKDKKTNKDKKQVSTTITKQEIKRDAERIRDQLMSYGFGNRIAQNTRADAAKYSVIPTYAYRPADSPQHILKSKNDLIKILNQQELKYNDQIVENDDEIKRAKARTQELREIAEKYRTDKRSALLEQQRAKEQAEREKQEFKQWERDQERQHNKRINDMRRQFERDEKTQHWKAKEDEYKQQLAIDKAIHKAKMNAQQQQAARDHYKRDKEHDQIVQQHQIDKIKWLGSYKRDEHGNIMLDSDGKPILRHGAKQFANKDIIFDKGESQYLQEEKSLAIKKIELEFQRQTTQIQAELEKQAKTQQLENSPDYIKLLADRDKALKTQYEYELQQKINKRNSKLQSEIDSINHKITLIKTNNDSSTKALQDQLQKLNQQYTIEKNNEALRQQISQVNRKLSEQQQKNARDTELEAQLASKRQQLINMRAEASQHKNIAKLQRQAAEIEAQCGQAQRLHEQILQHESDLRDIKQDIKDKQTTIRGIQQETTRYRPIAEQLTKQTQQYISNAEATINKLKPYLTKDESDSIDQQRDPTSALARLREIGQQKIETRQQFVDRALAVGQPIYDAVGRDPIMAKVGTTLANAQRLYNQKHGEIQASDIQDFDRIVILQPSPDVIEQNFANTFIDST